MEKIVFIDTLTTGMNPERCAIYRIGGIVVVDGTERSRFDLRCCPPSGARINDQSLWIGGESRASVIRYPDQADAFRDFLSVIDETVVLRNPNDKAYLAGFNASAFDVPFLREWFRKNGNERFRDYFHVQTMDLMTLSAFALMQERENLPNFHLESAAEALGVKAPIGGKYDCISNAELAKELFFTLREKFGTGSGSDGKATDKVFTNVKNHSQK